MMIQLDYNTATHNDRIKVLAHIERYIGNGNKKITEEYILSFIICTIYSDHMCMPSIYHITGSQ